MTNSGEASAVPLPWSCHVTFLFADLPVLDRETHGHTAADAAALGRALAERAVIQGVWVSAYVLVPAHRLVTVTLADPVQAKGTR
jgi:hypothetical protein